MTDLNEYILGTNEYTGHGNCDFKISIGNPDDDAVPILIDCGNVTLSKSYFGDYIILECKFSDENKNGLTDGYNAFKDYERYVDAMDGMPDKDHQIFGMFVHDDPYSKGFFMGANPVFWAVVSSDLSCVPDTLRMSFRNEDFVMYSYNESDILYRAIDDDEPVEDDDAEQV